MSRLSEDATGHRFAIDSFNVHRLVIAGVTVASKFFSDVFYTNSRYAKVGGLPQAELNQLELQFLLLNDFRLSIPSEEMQRYADHLVATEDGQLGPTPSSNIGSGIANGGVQPATQNSTMTSVPMQRASAQSHPMQSMGAIDAYGGSVGQYEHAQQRHLREDDPPRNASTPRRRPTSPSSASIPPPTPADESFERESSCGASVYSETDTDDEPTIRPTNSCGNSETQSLYSNDGANDEDEGAPVSEEDIARRLLRSRPTHRRWDSSSSSVDGEDAQMASP